MDDTRRQAGRPAPLELVELAADLVAEPRRHLVGACRRALEERSPALHRERVRPSQREALAGKVQVSEHAAHGSAVVGARPAHPDAAEEGDNRRRPAGKAPECVAGAIVHGQRAGDAAAGKMLHEAEEERQVDGRHPLLVEGQYVLALLGDEQVVGILDALGDALQRNHAAEVVALHEGIELLVGKIGIYRHAGID